MESQQSLLFECPESQHETEDHGELVASYNIHIKKSKPKPSKAFRTYWEFAFKRQSIFLDRLAGSNGYPWTADAILQKHRFTNVYRASDRVSQYLIRNVIYDRAWNFSDTVFRILIFKIFNKIETWELISARLGEVVWRKNILAEIGQILSEAFSQGQRIYSAAYIMPSVKSAFGHDRKHMNHLDLIAHVMEPERLNSIRAPNSMHGLVDRLMDLPGIGPFLAYQLATDLNYSEQFDFSENDFALAGPGAKHGIRKCFEDPGEYSFEEIISLMVDLQEEAFRDQELDFPYLWGRKLHLIDCQNLFCEVDKYCRVRHPDIQIEGGRTRIKQSFKPDLSLIQYFFPPKWDLQPA